MQTLEAYTVNVIGRLFCDGWRVLAAAVYAFAVSVWMDTPIGIQKMLVAAAVMFVCDLLSGAIRAWRDCGFSSNAFGQTLVKFSVYCISIIAACAMDTAFSAEHAALAAISTLVFLREATSVVENTAALGFPWPDSITDKLAALKNSQCDIGGDSDADH